MPVPSEQYFSRDPQSASQPKRIKVVLHGQRLDFVTDRGVFSPDHIDPGSRLLIETMEIRPGERVLDVGAGYGPISLVAARLAGPDGQVTAVECNNRAADLIVQNAALNHIEGVRVVVTDAFEPDEVGPQDVVVTNPPVRAGKQVAFDLVRRAAACLVPDGRLYLVGQKHLGVRSYEALLDELLGPVDTLAKSGGYRVLLAMKEPERGDG